MEMVVIGWFVSGIISIGIAVIASPGPMTQERLATSRVMLLGGLFSLIYTLTIVATHMLKKEQNIL